MRDGRGCWWGWRSWLGCSWPCGWRQDEPPGAGRDDRRDGVRDGGLAGESGAGGRAGDTSEVKAREANELVGVCAECAGCGGAALCSGAFLSRGNESKRMIDIDWKAIRSDYESGRTPLRALADRYGISKTTLIRKRNSEKWEKPSDGPWTGPVPPMVHA